MSILRAFVQDILLPLGSLILTAYLIHQAAFEAWQIPLLLAFLGHPLARRIVRNDPPQDRQPKGRPRR